MIIVAVEVVGRGSGVRAEANARAGGVQLLEAVLHVGVDRSGARDSVR